MGYSWEIASQTSEVTLLAFDMSVFTAQNEIFL